MIRRWYIAQLFLTLCDPLDCSPPGSSVHGILQARILEWVAISSSRGSSQPRDWTHISCISCISRRILYHWVTTMMIKSKIRNRLCLYGEKKEINTRLNIFSMEVENDKCQDLPGSPVIRTSPSNAENPGLIPGQGANKIWHALGPKKKKPP